MAYAIVRDGSPEEIFGAFADAAGVQHPASVLRSWTPAALAGIGLRAIHEGGVPEGHYSTGWRLVLEGGIVARVHTSAPVDLLGLKAVLKAEIDAAAEVERNRYITPGAGQAMTYQAKSAEAARFASDADPQAGDYPLLAAEVGITGETLGDVAGVVAAAHAQWLAIGALIEAARLAAKAAVDAAENAAAARAVTPAWPAP